MRLSLRFIVPLLLALGAFAYAAVPVVDKLTLKWFVRDLDGRASLIANTVEEPLQDLIRAGNRTKILQFFTRITRDERLYAMAFCQSANAQPVATPTLPSAIRCTNLDRFSGSSEHLLERAEGPLLVSVRTLDGGGGGGGGAAGAPGGKLVLVHDMSFIARRSEETRKYLFLFFVGLGATVSLITVAIAQLSWRGWVQGLRALLRGEGLLRPSDKSELPELRPIARDLRALIHDIEAEHRSRDEEQLAWTPETLRGILHGELRGLEVIVVANREPYIHVPSARKWRSGGRRAAWRRRWSRSCAPAPARGSPTGAAPPIARSWTSTTGWPCPRSDRRTSSAACG